VELSFANSAPASIRTGFQVSDNLIEQVLIEGPPLEAGHAVKTSHT
jgi:hypothetical protein